MRANSVRESFRRLLGSVEMLEQRRLLTADFRAIDGADNNAEHPDWGTAGTQLLRTTTVEYGGGESQPAGGADGSGRPNPRAISNAVVAQDTEIFNDRALTGFVFQWGQFLDHDLDLTEEVIPTENFSIEVPVDDPHMLPTTTIPLLRSRFDPATGTTDPETGVHIPRQQINQITGFIDASNVYGSDADRAAALRTGSGGLLKTSGRGLLPYNFPGDEGNFFHNAAPPPFAPNEYFLAGDVRANEQPGLTSMHTLFLREHNRLATEMAAEEYAGQDLDDADVDEEIYQRARQMVGALVQSITYNEFLPALLGPNGVASYVGYNAAVNPGIANIFSAAIYRVGHTMLPNDLVLGDNAGSMPLADSFFQPSIIPSMGIEPFLKGLSVLQVQEIDAKVSDSVRNMLFDPPAQFDLAAINIQRGRDHGLPDYNQARIDLGLTPVRRFSQITSDRSTARDLARAYERNINNIDVWLGAIAEDHIAGGSVGELIQTVLVDQFQRSRDGDRFYYENILEQELLREVQATRLADIIRRNTEVGSIQDEVFRSEQVFVYRAPHDAPSRITLQVNRGHVQIIDSASGEVLADRNKSDVTSVVLFGSSADDTITLDNSIDRLRSAIEVHGGGGQDRLHLRGGHGADSVVIGAGEIQFNRTSIYFGTVESIEVEAGGGNDFVLGSGSSVPLILAGGNGNDILIGSRFGDFIAGGNGRDLLIGLGGDDLLVGGRGRDIVFGGWGNDILVGGRGRDILVGGPGRDLAIQGSFPTDPDRNDPLWDAALEIWWDEIARYGLE